MTLIDFLISVTEPISPPPEDNSSPIGFISCVECTKGPELCKKCWNIDDLEDR